MQVQTSVKVSLDVFKTTRFFYKNKLYKNTQDEICPQIKNN